MKKFLIFVTILSIIQLYRINMLMALSNSDIYLSSSVLPQGDLILIRIKVNNNEVPIVTWKDKDINLFSSSDNSVRQGFLAVDVAEEPASYTAIIKALNSVKTYGFQIDVISKDYGVRRLTLPKNMVDPDTESLKRIQEESLKMAELWKNSVPFPIWNGPFIRPAPGKVIGKFGRKSIINDQPRAPHSGIDIRGKRGSPVKAANHGKVVLSEDLFFSGNSVVIDHGGDIQSMYFHLDKIQVKTGDMVKKGGIIGLMGSTGRATGPHLHFGIRINGARIDPLRLIAISKDMEE